MVSHPLAPRNLGATTLFSPKIDVQQRTVEQERLLRTECAGTAHNLQWLPHFQFLSQEDGASGVSDPSTKDPSSFVSTPEPSPPKDQTLWASLLLLPDSSMHQLESGIQGAKHDD